MGERITIRRSEFSLSDLRKSVRSRLRLEIPCRKNRKTVFTRRADHDFDSCDAFLCAIKASANRKSISVLISTDSNSSMINGIISVPVVDLRSHRLLGRKTSIEAF